MADILEFISFILANWIYGKDDRPRHPVWRNSVRAIAFAGVVVSSAYLLGFLGARQIPEILTLAWGLCSVIVISAEYYLGSKRVCVAALIAYPIWLAILIYTRV